jgi:hypothetical protein
MANLSAVDFGFITIGQFLERCSNTFSTLQNMERYRGHFYNWYDTQTLRPLPPRYISTVDSGNLAGHLLTLRQAVIAMPGQPIITPVLFEGLNDTLQVLAGEMKNTDELEAFQKTIGEVRTLELFTISVVKPLLAKLISTAELIMSDNSADPQSNQYWWSHKLLVQTKHIEEELSVMVPWFLLSPAPDRISQITTYRSCTQPDGNCKY